MSARPPQPGSPAADARGVRRRRKRTDLVDLPRSASLSDEAVGIAREMMKFNSHFTLHIGDVYYVGDPMEVNENCLGIRNPANNYDRVVWPIGSLGGFAMNGNHEMYANDIGYFDVLLPRKAGQLRAVQLLSCKKVINDPDFHGPP